jgi:hypothetical protein
MRTGMVLVKLEQVDWEQRDVKEKHRINMSEQAVRNEQEVAYHCDRAK